MTPWTDSLVHSFGEALDLLADGVRDCPADLWETGMWPVPAPGPDDEFLDADWNPITDPEQRDTLVARWVQRYSTPWSVAWHALEVLDYDLSGELEPWAPPAPFSGHPHWRDLATLPDVWAPSDILGYIDHCRGRVRDTLTDMTDERAGTPLPESHRYAGQPYARVIASLIGHTTEHASQIRQFLTASGVATDA